MKLRLFIKQLLGVETSAYHTDPPFAFCHVGSPSPRMHYSVTVHPYIGLNKNCNVCDPANHPGGGGEVVH